MKRLVCLLALSLGAPMARAQSVSKTDPMRLLPLGSRHIFRPAPREWTAKVQYLRPRRYQGKVNGLIVLDASQKPDLKTDWRQVRYFDTASEKDPSKFRKLLTLQADGRPDSETDRDGRQQFIRTFRRDGTVGFYEQIQTDRYKAIAAWSVSPDKKWMSAFSGGTGDLIQWDDKGGHIHIWFFDGDAYLSKKAESKETVEESLVLPKGEALTITKTGEMLSYQHEFWFKDFGKPIRAQVGDFHIDGTNGSLVGDSFPEDDIKKHIRASYPRIYISYRRRGEKPDAKLMQQLEKDYLTRRAEFMGNYGQVLRKAGQSWESLGLQDIQTPHLGNNAGKTQIP